MEWHIYIDGASSGNPGEAGAGIVVFDRNQNEILSESIYLGHMTNNMAEYSALIAALKKAEKACIKDLFIYTDSQLVAYQIQGKYKVKNQQLSEYVEKAKKIIKLFDNFDIQYIPRAKNKLADKLAKDGTNKKRVDG